MFVPIQLSNAHIVKSSISQLAEVIASYYLLKTSPMTSTSHVHKAENKICIKTKNTS